MFKKILFALIAIFIALQFIPVDFTNPTVEGNNDFFTLTDTNAEVQSLVKSSCYDCHSNTTTYPDYAKIAPINFWLKSHIDEGRSHLNFSEWGNYDVKKQHHKLEECVEVLEKNEMPLASYTLMHNEAKLSPEQKSKLITFFKSIN